MQKSYPLLVKSKLFRKSPPPVHGSWFTAYLRIDKEKQILVFSASRSNFQPSNRSDDSQIDPAQLSLWDFKPKFRNFCPQKDSEMYTIELHGRLRIGCRSLKFKIASTSEYGNLESTLQQIYANPVSGKSILSDGDQESRVNAKQKEEDFQIFDSNIYEEFADASCFPAFFVNIKNCATNHPLRLLKLKEGDQLHLYMSKDSLELLNDIKTRLCRWQHSNIRRFGLNGPLLMLDLGARSEFGQLQLTVSVAGGRDSELLRRLLEATHARPLLQDREANEVYECDDYYYASVKKDSTAAVSLPQPPPPPELKPQQQQEQQSCEASQAVNRWPGAEAVALPQSPGAFQRLVLDIIGDCEAGQIAAFAL